MVLIPKGNTDTQGIGLLEMLWKVVESIIDTHLWSSIQFHNVLHRFRAGWGKRTATIEIKIAQELASVDQYPLFLRFLDLRKAYDTVDRGWLISSLEGYGAGPHMCNLLATLWAHQEVVTSHNGYHSPNFMGRHREGSSHRPCSIWWWIMCCWRVWQWLSNIRRWHRRYWASIWGDAWEFPTPTTSWSCHRTQSGFRMISMFL